ncbi:hypothetical protein [Prosthecobacter sp.]|uniref:hypothetical protein n=1 Tax=Prosthecobacter sp. TaxID=1965333 RepID=UPI003782DD54
MSDSLPDPRTPVVVDPNEGEEKPREGPISSQPSAQAVQGSQEEVSPIATPAAIILPAPASAETGAPLPTRGLWYRLGPWVTLTALDDIDPEKVRNSTAFKLGALAGLLPALSVMSLARFLTPDQSGVLDTSGPGTLWSALGVLFSSALVGGAVAFFWAENRLRTIFTYGVAGPTVVLSMFLSGVGNVAANKKIESVQKASEMELKAKAKEIHDAANQHLETEIQKVVNATNIKNSPPPSLPSSVPSDVPVASNPDLAPP